MEYFTSRKCFLSMLCLPLEYLLLLAFTALSAHPVYAGETALLKQCTGYNLLMISITNIGTEHMSLYGYSRKTTPELDKLAADAFVFEKAFTPASWTLPVASSLFTSLYPYTHRIMGRRRNLLLSKNTKTLPEIMKAYGYKTAAFTGGLDYMVSLGHMRGFETAADNPPFTKFGVTIPQAKKWLTENSGKKFFLFVQGYDPHPPFAPTARFKGVFSSTEGRHVTVDPGFAYRGYMETPSKEMTVYYHAPRISARKPGKEPKQVVLESKTTLAADDMDYLRDLYDETIEDDDQYVSDLIGSLGKEVLEKTIVVILSEHGEMFAKHGRFGRAGAIRGTLYDDVVHVPLLIMYPGVRGRHIDGLVQLIDVMPTVLESLGIPAPSGIQGKTLTPLISAGTPVNEYVYGGTKFKFKTNMPETYVAYGYANLNEYIRDNRWKLIHEVTFGDPRKGTAGNDALETYELYDIKNDTGEAVNLTSKYPDVLKNLSEKLKLWRVEAQRSAKKAPGTHEIPEAVLEQAKQHGYW